MELETMLISIGILAWNEERNIETTLQSLLDQSIFRTGVSRERGWEWEIVVVPNGCVDRTAEVATAALAELVSSGDVFRVEWSVKTLAQAGKSNAWNHFIHEFSSESAEFYVLLDADIVFGQHQTIENTLLALLDNPHAAVAVDLPLKDTVLKSRKSLVEWISVAGSQAATAGPPGICGQFYCARAEVLRQIWMPAGLSGEDGFVRAMVVTDCFRKHVDETKVIRAENAVHYFEGLSSLKAIFRHELRLVIGTTLNCYLMWDCLLFCTDPNGRGAGMMIRERLSQDPDWYQRFIYNAIRNRGWWRLPRGMLWRRFRRLRTANGQWRFSPRALIVAIIGFALDIPVFLAANWRLGRKQVIGYW